MIGLVASRLISFFRLLTNQNPDTDLILRFMILRFRNLDLSIGRILKFNFLLKIKIRQQDGFLLELNLTFEENVLKFLRQIDTRDFK